MDIVTYALLNGKIKNYASNVDEWLEENVDPATGYVLDRSLQMENAAAPADMVGEINDEVGDLKNTFNTEFEQYLNVDYLEPTETGKYIQIINSNTVDIEHPQTAASYSYYIVPCQKDDVFIINGEGGIGTRLWIMAAANNTVLLKADENATAKDLVLTIPANVAYLVINEKTNATQLYSRPIGKKLDDLKSLLQSADEQIDKGHSIYEGVTKLSVTGEGQAILTDSSSINPSTPTSAPNYNYYLASCKYGDRFVINGYGGIGARLWAWIASDYSIIDKAGADATADSLELIAPFNASYLLINTRKKEVNQYKGNTVYKQVRNYEFADYNRVVKVPSSELVIGSYVINSGKVGTDSNVARFRTANLIKVNKGDIVRLNYPKCAMNVCEVDANGTAAFTVWTNRDFSHTTGARVMDYIVSKDCYIGINFLLYQSNTPDAFWNDKISNVSSYISNYDGIVSIIHQYKTDEDETVNTPPKSIKRKPIKINGPSVGQDGCFIDGELWMFNDGSNGEGQIKIVDMSNPSEYGSKTHTLGHANSVSYNSTSKTLCSYGSNGDNEPTIVLYQNPQNAELLSLSDASCIVIPLYDSNAHLNISASLCFGEDEQIVYFIEGPYQNQADMSSTWDKWVIKENRKIFKIQLGMGDNDLSSGGYGTFVSGKSQTEYNGTCRIIQTYEGTVDGDMLEKVNPELIIPQGLDYDGYLYLGFGTKGNNVVVIELDEFRQTYRVVDNYKFTDYNYARQQQNWEAELVALDGCSLYYGAYQGGNSLLLKYNRC